MPPEHMDVSRDESHLSFVPQYHAHALLNWAVSNVHMFWQSYHVIAFMTLRRLEPGLLAEVHPWVTGLRPDTGRPIWPDNIIYATPRASQWIGPPPADDAEIVTKVGRFMAGMVARSVPAMPEIAQGAARRMPHAVNYIHGTVHFNGGFLLFNDFADLMSHLADPEFRRELRRFARTERREHTLVVRERRYHPEEFAWLVCFARARFPWYANGNGPTKKRVLWGTPSPYPNVNLINGSWVSDLQALRRGRPLTLTAIVTGRYFQGEYGSSAGVFEYSFLERFHAWTQHLVISAKRFQGGLAFTSRRKIEPRNWEEYRATNGRWRASYPVSHPFRTIAAARALRAAWSSREVAGDMPGYDSGVTGDAANVRRGEGSAELVAK